VAVTSGSTTSLLDRPDRSGEPDDSRGVNDPEATDVAVDGELSIDDGRSIEEKAAVLIEQRWFLVPPAPTPIDSIDQRDRLWAEAQGGGGFDPQVVTTDRANPTSAGLAWVYHLDDVSMYRIGDPDWTYRDIMVDGRPVRVGAQPERDRVEVYTTSNPASGASSPGAFVVISAGLDEGQAIDLALAARLVDGQADLTGNLPDGLTLVAPRPSAPADHSTSIGWGSGPEQYRLEIEPTTIEKGLVGRKSAGVEVVTVRGGDGVFFPVGANLYWNSQPALMWAEDGYVITLVEGEFRFPSSDAESIDPQADSDARDRLVTVAESLRRVDQDTLASLLGDAGFDDQAATVAQWFRATPLPDGFDPVPLVAAVPQDRLRVASLVRQYLSCTWFAEWADAIGRGDQERRAEAAAVLAAEEDWPVAKVEAEILRSYIAESGAEPPGPGLISDIDRRSELLAEVTTPAQLAELESTNGPRYDFGCGFQVPGR
jgi:hypothetical protein